MVPSFPRLHPSSSPTEHADDVCFRFLSIRHVDFRWNYRRSEQVKLFAETQDRSALPPPFSGIFATNSPHTKFPDENPLRIA